MRTTAGRRLGRIVLGILAVLVAVAATAMIGVVGLLGWTTSPYQPAAVPVVGPAALPPPVLTPGRPAVAIVVGGRGAEVGDVLGPYETLSASGAVDVVVVGPDTGPVPLTGGLDLAPQVRFDQLDGLLGAAGSTLAAIVVPAMPDVGEPSNQSVRDWLRQRRATTPIVLSVCNGAAVAASAGLLDGHTATSHWLRLAGLRDRYPQVDWQDGIRWVDDGGLISTGGILSGIDGTLHLLERLAGRAVAVHAAEQIGWRHHRPGSANPLPGSELGPQDTVALLNAGFRWDRSRIGVLLADGVGELELASAFDPYGGQSYAAETLAVGDTAVTTRHGLTVYPRTPLAEAPARVDRLLVPGLGAATDHRSALTARVRAVGLEPQFLHERSGFPFDAALTDLARTVDVPTARWTAKILEYPEADLDLRGPPLPWSLVGRPLAIMLAVALLLFQIPRLVRTVRAWTAAPRPVVEDPVLRAAPVVDSAGAQPGTA